MTATLTYSNGWARSTSHGFHATFYVNSGTIGTAGHLTWAQLTGSVAVKATEQVIGGTFVTPFCC